MVNSYFSHDTSFSCTLWPTHTKKVMFSSYMLIKKIKDFKEQKGRTYLYAHVFKILIRCEVNNANKSIRVTDLTSVPLSCVLYHLEVVRNATLFLNTFNSATTFCVHLYFLDGVSSQPSLVYWGSKVHGLETWFQNTTNTVDGSASQKK